MSDCDYRIYPSLLDRFQTLLDYEQEAEQPWNLVSETAKKRGDYPDLDVGDYIMSPDELAMKLEVELIDAINRVDYGDVKVAADRGTALNEIIDCMVMRRKSTRDDVVIERQRDADGKTTSLRADINGGVYTFDVALCRKLRDYFAGSVCQYLAKAPLVTDLGVVELYGYIDYWALDKVYDLKTTTRYEWGKYERKWQRHVYPYCLVESGVIPEIAEMEFTVVQLKQATKSGIYTGDIYTEVYSVVPDRTRHALVEMCDRFIGWLESVRPAITDRRIFGGENAPDYRGVAMAERLDLSSDPRLAELCDYAYGQGMFNKKKNKAR